MDFKTILQEKIKNITIKLNEDSIPGGVGDNKTPESIAKKHGVSVESIKSEIELGMKTEKEHTGNDKKKREIATDHVWEHPKYYSDKKHGLNASEKKLDETVTPQQMDAQNKKVVQTSVTAANEKAKKAKMDADAATAQAKSIQSAQASAKPSVGTLGEDGTSDKAVEPPKEELTNTGVTPEQEQKIKDFLIANQGLDDTKFHAFVQSMGVDPHEAEELVYKIVYDLGQIILGATKAETTPEPEIAPEEPATIDETPVVTKPMNEKVSRFAKSKMDILKEGWASVAFAENNNDAVEIKAPENQDIKNTLDILIKNGYIEKLREKLKTTKDLLSQDALNALESYKANPNNPLNDIVIRSLKKWIATLKLGQDNVQNLTPGDVEFQKKGFSQAPSVPQMNRR